ncbi:MAG: hypothetical protein EP346_02100 [Bacteroidetes bacterium]|nr:MAG: hypothetical protein EP346_02100 [Bacteroidota bacterium]
MSESDQEIVTLFVSASMLILMMVALVIVFVLSYQRRVWRQKSAMQALEAEHQLNLLFSAHKAIEATRKRIAGNLHDELGANISAAKLQLQNAKSDEASLEKANEILDESLRGLRRIVNDLLPPTLERFGLKSAISELCAQATTSELSVDLEWLGEEVDLDDSIQLPVFRIAQELLNNSLKHAQASVILFTVSTDETHLSLSYEENGVGFNVDHMVRNIGLDNMHSRAAMLHGSFRFKSAINEGFKAIVEIPLPQKEIQ